MNKVQQVLVAGSNGTTGRIIIDLLEKSDVYQPIAMVRKKDQKERFEKKGITTVMADLEKDLSHAVENAHKIIFAAGSGGKNVIAVDQEGAKRLTKAASEAGITKFVMLSTMGADNPSMNKELEKYLQAKQNADNYLRDSGLKYSIVRPGQLTNEDSIGKITLAEKLEQQGKIARADVAQTLVEVLDDRLKPNQTFEIISGNVTIQKAII